MLASELAEIAQHLVSEAQRHNLINLLKTARSIAANRDSLGEGNYRKEAAKIRNLAVTIIEDNIFETYPEELLRELRSSKISALLPSRIANLILAAIPETNMEDASASAEFNIYINQAQEVQRYAEGLLQFTNAFGVEEYNIDTGQSSFRLLLPRHSFKNEFGKFGEKLSPYNKLFLSISELYTGSRKSPEIVYISTSDPSFFLQWLPEAVGGLLLMYTPIMEAAEKTINVIRATKDLFSAGADEKTIRELESKLLEQNERTVKAVIEKHLEGVKGRSDAGRTAELKIEITMHASYIAKEVANGSRFSFGTGAFQEDNEEKEDLNDDYFERKALIAHQKNIENRLNNLMKGFEDKQMLLQSRSDKNEEA